MQIKKVRQNDERKSKIDNTRKRQICSTTTAIYQQKSTRPTSEQRERKKVMRSKQITPAKNKDNQETIEESSESEAEQIKKALQRTRVKKSKI